MQSSIGTLACTFVITPESLPEAVPMGRLEQVLRGPVAEQLTESLERMLGDPDPVYLVRQVQADVVLTGADEEALDATAPGEESSAWEIAPPQARRWADRLAAAVVRTIAADPGDGTNLVRFDDEADYLSGYLADVVAGRAGERWYYYPLHRWPDRSLGETFEAVLELAAAPATLLARLHIIDPQLLAELIEVLPRPGLAALAEAVLGAPADNGPVSAAARLAEALGLWTGPPWPVTRIRAACPPVVVDWRSRQGLTDAVLDVLARLARLGALAPPRESPEFVVHQDFSWLDADRLIAGLRFVEGPDRAASPQAGPRQRDLLAALALVVTELAPELAPGQGAALRIQAALLAADPRWSGDPLVGPTIHGLVERWGKASGSASGATALVSLSEASDSRTSDSGTSDGGTRGSGTADGRGPGPAPPPETDPELGTLPGDDLIRRLLLSGATPGPAGTVAAAGVLLLVRTVLDLRLTAIIRRVLGPDLDPDAVPAALLSAADELSGTGPGLVSADPGGTDPPGGERPIDPAVAAFAGFCVLPSAGRVRDLRGWWNDRPAATRRALRRELIDVLKAQGLPNPQWRPDPDRPVDPDAVGPLLAAALLRAWARWLGPFAGSSPDYLFTEFIRRPGRLVVRPDRLTVVLASRPLDLVLQQAGYFAALPAVGLLGGRDLILRPEE